MIKRILNISLWIIAILSVLAFAIYALHLNDETTCNTLEIELQNKNIYLQLTSEIELRTELLQNHLPIEGQKIKNLNLKQIEKNIGQISYLQDFNAYFNINGNVTITASPRKAIVRVYNKAGQHFYLGSDTVVMPLSPHHSLRLLLANGALPKLPNAHFTRSWNDAPNLPDIYKKIFTLAAKIQNDEFLNALIDQIYVKPDLEFELIPKAGVGLIEFGNIENADDKLKRLKNFYIKGNEKINWNIYKSINLKYENQVVCTKK